jgi:hypothetical protein
VASLAGAQAASLDAAAGATSASAFAATPSVGARGGTDGEASARVAPAAASTTDDRRTTARKIMSLKSVMQPKIKAIIRKWMDGKIK